MERRARAPGTGIDQRNAAGHRTTGLSNHLGSAEVVA